MKILMVHQHYFPEMSGTARRTKELAESFIKRGNEVSVVTSFPREFRSVSNEKSRLFENINGVKVFRVKTLFEIKKNVLFRMFSYLSFVLQSISLALKLSRQSNIVISVAPLSSGVIGSLVQIFGRKHHHFDVPDILPDLGISAGMIKNKFIIFLLYKMEKWVYNHSTTISAITYGQLNNIHSKGAPRAKLFYIPDWIDEIFFVENLKKYKTKVSAKLVFPNKKLISFVGNIGALQNPEVFIEIMASLREGNHDEFEFLFIGDGIMLPYLKEKVKKLSINNVKFIGRVKREYIPAFMNLSDILVANYLPNNYMDICIPGKLYEYAISKRPIIMGARGEAKNLIEKYSLGLAVTPSDVKSFKEAIIQISNGSFQFKPSSEKFVQDFSLHKISKLYDRIFAKVK